MFKTLLLALVALTLNIVTVDFAFAGGAHGVASCSIDGTAKITIDGETHCQVVHVSAGMGHCTAAQGILIMDPGMAKATCAKGTIVGAVQVIVDGGDSNKVVSGHGTAHCPAGTQLVTHNGAPACQGPTTVVCNQDLSRKDVPSDAINVVWHQDACNFSYDILN